MNEIDVYSHETLVLPKDYHPEMRLDERNCLVSNRISLSPEEQLRIAKNPFGWHYIRTWTEKVGRELIEAARKQYECLYEIAYIDFIVMSDQQQMHTLEVWIKSRRPLTNLQLQKLKKL